MYGNRFDQILVNRFLYCLAFKILYFYDKIYFVKEKGEDHDLFR